MNRRRALTGTETRIAGMTLELISDWMRWVHRRVESLEYEDERTVRRSVSVDFTLPRDLPSPLPQSNGEDVYPVPLALLRKAILRRFDIRDESGRALPLMTAPKNGAVAAGVLLTAAESVPSDLELAGLPRTVPDEITDEIWLMANRPGRAAVEGWERFIHPLDTDSYGGTVWRRLLGESHDFMALASDLSRNFLVLTPLLTPPGRRRIVKFAYEETQEHVDALLDKPSAPRRRRRTLREIVAAERQAGAPGAGVVWIRATTLRIEDDAMELIPLDVEVVIKGPSDLATRVRTGATGDYAIQLPAGIYTLEANVPHGQVELSQRQRLITLTRGEKRVERFQFRPIAQLQHQVEGETMKSRRWRVRIGWDPDYKLFPIPSVAQTQSSHVEFEVPEGLQVTHSRLDLRDVFYRAPGPDEPDQERQPAEERQKMQRSHLYLTAAPSGTTGVARFALRPRASTVVRAAALSAIVTTALLVVIRLSLARAGPNVDSVAALLLLLPGGLAAYVARPREHLIATGMLFGLRLLALGEGLLAVVAAVIVVFSRHWVDVNGTFEAGASSATLRSLLWGLVGVSGVNSLVLIRTWARTSHPPEAKSILEAQ